MDALTRKSYELRKDIIEMMHKSKAGHVGGDLSVIDILNVLYNEIMNVTPENFKDDNRDRFLLSKGHCADALFVVLGDKGFFDKQEAIDTFSQYNSKFIGHPNTDVNGIEINSGSLGHGLSIGVGMAIAGKMDSRSYRTYVVLGDGEITLEIAKMALQKLEIDDLGLDNIDKKILETIIYHYSGGPVGLETLAATVNEETTTIEDVYEPYLMQIGFLQRTPRGRCVTAEGYRHLGYDFGKSNNQPTLFGNN